AFRKMLFTGLACCASFSSLSAIRIVPGPLGSCGTSSEKPLSLAHTVASTRQKTPPHRRPNINFEFAGEQDFFRRFRTGILTRLLIFKRIDQRAVQTIDHGTKFVKLAVTLAWLTYFAQSRNRGTKAIPG